MPANPEASRVRALTKQERIAERKAKLEEIRAGGARLAAAEKERERVEEFERRVAATSFEQRQRQRERELDLVKLTAPK